MRVRWEKKLNILGPIRQAERCVESWLKETGRELTFQQKQRAAALMARYFYHEDQVTDQLMLSFLRHYSGMHEVDMEDPTSVRREIKAVLDKSQPQEEKNWVSPALTAICVIGVGMWLMSHQTISRYQQAELKTLVHRIAELDSNTTRAAIWAETKEPLHVRSYQEMNLLNYLQSRAVLEKRLNDVEHRQIASAIMGARM